MKKQLFFKSAKGFLLCSSLILSISSFGQNFYEIVKAVASDRATNDYFGTSVSISSNYAIVGAYGEDEDASGGNTLGLAGSAYIFERDGSGNWIQVQKIVASDRESNDLFGRVVSISGNYAIVGAYDECHDASGGNYRYRAGSAYIFERDGSGNWTQVQKIVASDRASSDRFGFSVAISGNYAIAGARFEDEDASGGNTLIEAGSAYIFERDGSGNWTQVQKIVASDRAISDRFGSSVSISGNYAIVGVYEEDEDASGGNTLPAAGSAYIFERDAGGNWSQVQKIVASDRASGDSFGGSISISGNYAIVGSQGEDEDASGGNTLNSAGSSYVFERDAGDNWTQVQKIVASDRASGDLFGISTSISGNYAVIGASYEEEDASGGNTLSGAGSAYVFKRNGSGNWTQVQKIVASDRAMVDQFGFSVSVSGDYIIAGAYGQDEDASGGNTLSDAGSAYVFEYSSPLPIELISFNAMLTENNRIKLNWQTAMEINNDYFTVERAQYGISWEDVAVVNGSGNSSSPLNYSFIDHAPYNGLSYYRLKQTDFDGKYFYSKIVSININIPINNVHVFPNPTNARLIITGNNSELELIRIYSVMGEDVTNRISVINYTAQKKILDLSDLINGMYIIRTKTTTKKVYKQFRFSF